jgi:hypothetical protein
MNLREYLDFVITMVEPEYLYKVTERLKQIIPEEDINKIKLVYSEGNCGVKLIKELIKKFQLIKVLEESGFNYTQLPGREWNDYIIQMVEKTAGVR